ncbi:DUF4177 domain-containing protein [Acidaminobacter hydrogenoformans]|uniref:DUF4177 domain-containing protein n=1 Tax=Acidaminobacter hydrogenoformans DSM 2784 TaxID=1120920 RepID=A0A1G5RVS6_9FIRM|nr:DUF4177 domain-containing protein [Acidaminobacter hydrogenoformans]SCZ78212.1 protein of unknown function [Acidaminobacter hydrogenoformans DSM 2784]
MLEYRVEQFFAGGFFMGKVNKAEVENALNELAKQGWEVITVAPLNRFFGETHYVMYTLGRNNED